MQMVVLVALAGEVLIPTLPRTKVWMFLMRPMEPREVRPTSPSSARCLVVPVVVAAATGMLVLRQLKAAVLAEVPAEGSLSLLLVGISTWEPQAMFWRLVGMVDRLIRQGLPELAVAVAAVVLSCLPLIEFSTITRVCLVFALARVMVDLETTPPVVMGRMVEPG
ncbi:MAG: hypothetical protein CL675_11340 [Bdellovibrionaceae bacterium]|nr:hypothetical protein [Pseudobdellovibrionaceae bacterium]